MSFRVVPFVLLAAACGSSAPPAAPQPADVGDAGEEVCGPPPGRWVEGRDPPAFCVKDVAGAVTSGGAPLANKPMTVCGQACFYGTTDAAGAYRVRVNARLPDGQYTFFAHGRPSHASLYVPFPSGPAEQLVLPAIDLPALSSEGAALPADGAPATTVRSGPIELAVAEGTSWELAFEDAADEAVGRLLRWVKVAPAQAPAFATGAAVVYALAPFEAKPSKPVRLRLDDAGGLPAGAAVELVVMDGLDLTAPVNTSGKPKVAAKGHVSADGTSVTSDPGEGLSLLTWLAVRAL